MLNIKNVLLTKCTLGIVDIFDKAQLNTDKHPLLCKKLMAIYEKGNHDVFIKEFLHCLSVILIQDKSPPAERLLKFTTAYCIHHMQASNDDTDPLIYEVYEYLFKCHNREKLIIRFRVCEFINMLLSSMGEHAMLDDDVFAKLGECMLARLQDRLPSIRSQAALALFRLQDPTDKQCPIIRTLMFHLHNDPSPDVRASIVTHIALCHRTLDAVVTRINDKKDIVRKEAYKTISRIKTARFPLAKRQEILRMGLTDKNKLVRDFVRVDFLKAWFPTSERSYIQILNDVNVQTFGKHTKELLYAIFEREPVSTLIELMMCMQNGKKVVPVEKLNPETAALWRHLASYVDDKSEEEKGEGEEVKKICPELTYLTVYIREFIVSSPKLSMKEEFIVEELLNLAAVYSLTDEMGREQLRRLCVEILLKHANSSSLIGKLAEIMESVVPNVEDRMKQMLEIISDILDPLECDGNAQVGNGGDETDEDKVDRKKDPQLVYKCLRMEKAFLKSKSVKSIGSDVLIHQTVFIGEWRLNQTYPLISQTAIEVSTLLALRDIRVARAVFVEIFGYIGQDDLACAALQFLFDVICMYGLDSFIQQMEPSCEENTGKEIAHGFRRNNFSAKGTSSNIALLKDPELSDHERKFLSLLIFVFLNGNENLKLTCTSGFIKLFNAKRIFSPVIFAHLLLLWYGLGKDPGHKLYDPLTLFFSKFLSLHPQTGPRIMVQSFIQTLETITSAKEGDPLRHVEMSSVIDMFISSLHHERLPCEHNLSEIGTTYHFVLGEITVKYLIDNEGEMASPLCKLLLKLDFAQEDYKFMPNFGWNIGRVIKVLNGIVDRRTLNQLKTLKDKTYSFAETAALLVTKETSSVDAANGPVNKTRGKSKKNPKKVEKQKENIPETASPSSSHEVPDTPSPESVKSDGRRKHSDTSDNASSPEASVTISSRGRRRVKKKRSD